MTITNRETRDRARHRASTIFLFMLPSWLVMVVLGLAFLVSKPALGQIATPPNFDYFFCNTWGSVAIRGQYRWTCLPPGTAGYVLRTQGVGADPDWFNPSSGGTVTSVGISAPAIFSVSGSPITTTGTLALTLASQTQNLFFASPDGSSGAPTFRAISSNDLTGLSPAFNIVVSSANAPAHHWYEADQSADERRWRMGIDGKIMTLRVYNDALSAYGDILTITRGVGNAVSSVAIAPPVTLGTPLAVAQGGTGATAGSATLLDTLSGFSGTGYIQRTGAGAYSFVSVSTLGNSIASQSGATGSLLYRNGSALGWLAAGATAGQPLVSGGSGVAPVYGGAAIAASQSANRFLASPDGSAAVPSFRALAYGDLPAALTQQRLLSTITIGTQATAGLTGISSAYKVIRLRLGSVYCASNTQEIKFQVTEGGVTQTSNYTPWATDNVTTGNNAAYYSLTGGGTAYNASGAGVNGFMDINQKETGVFTNGVWHGSHVDASTVFHETHGAWRYTPGSGGTIDGFTISCASGNLAGGVIYVYGDTN